MVEIFLMGSLVCAQKCKVKKFDTCTRIGYCCRVGGGFPNMSLSSKQYGGRKIYFSNFGQRLMRSVRAEIYPVPSILRVSLMLTCCIILIIAVIIFRGPK